MPTTIFHTESGSTETWLTVNDDDTVIYHKENSGWTMARKGARPHEETMSVEQAKQRWQSYADDIDIAVAAKHK